MRKVPERETEDWLRFFSGDRWRRHDCFQKQSLHWEQIGRVERFWLCSRDNNEWGGERERITIREKRRTKSTRKSGRRGEWGVPAGEFRRRSYSASSGRISPPFGFTLLKIQREIIEEASRTNPSSFPSIRTDSLYILFRIGKSQISDFVTKTQSRLLHFIFYASVVVTQEGHVKEEWNCTIYLCSHKWKILNYNRFSIH